MSNVKTEALVDDIISKERLIVEHRGETKIGPEGATLFKMYHPLFDPEGSRWCLPESIYKWL